MHLTSLITIFSEHSGSEVLRCRVVPRQLKRDRRRVPRQVKSRAIFWFFGAFWGWVPPQLKRDQREKNWVASMLADEKEIQLKRSCKKRRNRTESHRRWREIERWETGVLRCFARHRQFRISYQFGLEREIASLFYI